MSGDPFAALGLIIGALIGGWIMSVVVIMPLMLGMFAFTVAIPAGLIHALKRWRVCAFTWPAWVPSWARIGLVVVTCLLGQVWLWLVGPMLFFAGLIHLLG